MQKRFCTCGQVILVNYVSRNGAWKPLILAGRKTSLRRKGPQTCCPGCGTPLDIDRLR